jgi:hypothetical protein
MAWTVVKGRYSHGIIEPLEQFPDQEDATVLILFPEGQHSRNVSGIWQQIKETIAEEMPDLLQMSDEARQLEFDQISQTIAERMPYKSLEEFERSMRGDKYGLARY